MLQVVPASESSAKKTDAANIMKLREAKTQGKIKRASARQSGRGRLSQRDEASEEESWLLNTMHRGQGKRLFFSQGQAPV